jgi:hypothetical protein
LLIFNCCDVFRVIGPGPRLDSTLAELRANSTLLESVGFAFAFVWSVEDSSVAMRKDVGFKKFLADLDIMAYPPVSVFTFSWSAKLLGFQTLFPPW